MSDEDEFLPTAHPAFAAHFRDPIYENLSDDSAPFGSDEAFDEVSEWLDRGVTPDLTLPAMLAESFGPGFDVAELDFDEEPLALITIALGFLLLRVNGQLDTEGRAAVFGALDWCTKNFGPGATNFNLVKGDLESFPH